MIAVAKYSNHRCDTLSPSAPLRHDEERQAPAGGSYTGSRFKMTEVLGPLFQLLPGLIGTRYHPVCFPGTEHAVCHVENEF